VILLSSIIDRIGQAEQTADAIRKEAAAKARYIAAEAINKINTEKSKEQKEGPERLKKAAERAQLEGEKTVEKIMDEARARAEKLRAESQKSRQKAVSYLMERIAP